MSADDRIEQFKAEVAELKLKTSGGKSEKTAGTIGLILMLLSIIVGVGSYINSTKAENALDQNELVILSIVCVVVAVVGSAMFLWTRLIAFWRFWMLRQIYELRQSVEAGRGDG